MGLLSRIFGSKNAAPETFRGPADRRIYAIGDIHGRADLLEILLARIDEDRQDADRPAEIVFLGDYVDRGDQSKSVIDLCLATKQRVSNDPRLTNVVFLRGNHEAAMQGFLDDPVEGAVWLSYGGLATVESYRAKGPANPVRPDDFIALSDGLKDALPDEHIQFLQNLTVFYQAGDYVFVHAAVHPSLPLADQPAETLYWGHKGFLEKPWIEPFKVVHGHTITDTPDVRSFRIGIDTGAYYTDCLTALCIDGADTYFLDTKPSDNAD